MPPTHRHPPHPIAVFHLLLLLLLLRVEAQPPSNQSSSSSSPNMSANFNPSMAIIIVVLVSAFFFLGFFSIYLRQCSGLQTDTLASASPAGGGGGLLIRIQRGLNPAILQTFPTLVYSQVKEHKIGKGALECAICLNEFEDDESIRLLPDCDHAFHQDCIDAWLAAHVTCPVCRANYSFYSPDRAPTAPTLAPPSVTEAEERREEMRELARIASRVRGSSKRIARSHSTGHSMAARGEERYTLRLPEGLRREIMEAGKELRRARTFAVAGGSSSGGEASMRRVSRGRRTVRLGRSDRWSSFFGRSLSGLGNWRRGEERAVSRRSSAVNVNVKTCVDSRRTGGSKGDESDEASTAALNRV